MKGKRPKLFYGWWVALTAALGLFLSSATTIVFTFGVFARAMGQEFHSGRARMSLAFTLHNLTTALCVPLAGRLVDRYGPRRVLLPFTFFLGLILLSSRVISGELWQLYVFYMALGVSGCSGVMSYTDVVSHWFDKRRGLALSVMMLGLGLGAIVMPPVAVQLVERFGWRLSYSIFGFAILLIPLPVVAAFLKERPRDVGLLPDGATKTQLVTPVAVEEQGLTMREALHTPDLWIIVGALFLVTASVHACFIHLPQILTDRGKTAKTAAFVSSLFGVGLFSGRVGCGYLLDRFFAPHVAVLLFGAIALGVALLGAVHGMWLVCFAALLVGLGVGAEVDIIGYLTSRYFGLRSFGEIFGWIWAVFGVSGGAGAYLMGVGFDKTGSYTVPLAGFFCAALLAMLLMTRLGPYRYRVRLPDESAPAQWITHSGS
jgi:MFS family permease